jgi:Na+/H+-translocating membrane pyrophosphatase
MSSPVATTAPITYSNFADPDFYSKHIEEIKKDMKMFQKMKYVEIRLYTEFHICGVFFKKTLMFLFSCTKISGICKQIFHIND